MYKLAKPFFIICESPLHVGSGNDLGIIDMPIQREKHTGFPKVESSSLKGSFRESFESYMDLVCKEYKYNDGLNESKELLEKFPGIDEKWTEKDGNIKIDDNKDHLIKYNQAINLTFGPEKGNEHAGAIGFTDARLLLFPVKSLKGVFGWVTCPSVLKKFTYDLKLAGINEGIPEIPQENTVPKNSNLLLKENKVILEEYTINVQQDDDSNDDSCKFAQWLAKKIVPEDEEYKYLKEKLEKDLVILTDEDFRDFVNLSTEVITRTKINNVTGTVDKGALFNEEYLPAESILYFFALSSPIFYEDKGVFDRENKKEEQKVMEFLTTGLPKVTQLGGNATLGKGIIRLRMVEVAKSEQ